MKPKIFLAVAGAGKTFQICNNLNPDKRNLILSYTNENISNIAKELIKKHGCVPKNTIVMTFDSFLLKFFIWPYYKIIQIQLFKKMYREQKNLLFVGRKFDKTKPWESKKNNFFHYFCITKSGNYVLLNGEVSSLILCDELKFDDGKTLFEKGVDRINSFFDTLYIDEFQDYRQDKYKLMVKIMNSVKQGIMYGDYYQHSVSGQNNSGAPFLKKTTYDSFKKEMTKNGFDVDDTSFKKTRRCSKNVCEFINGNLNIAIESDESMERVGNISYIFDDAELSRVLSIANLKTISLNNVKEWHSISYGLSKGNTYENTLVVIPDAYLTDGAQGIHGLSDGISKNKIYVALSRSIGDTYITSHTFMKKHFSL